LIYFEKIIFIPEKNPKATKIQIKSICAKIERKAKVETRTEVL